MKGGFLTRNSSVVSKVVLLVVKYLVLFLVTPTAAVGRGFVESGWTVSQYSEWGMRGWPMLGSVPLMGASVFMAIKGCKQNIQNWKGDRRCGYSKTNENEAIDSPTPRNNEAKMPHCKMYNPMMELSSVLPTTPIVTVLRVGDAWSVGVGKRASHGFQCLH